ncbi:MAG: flagellar filament capping protein FliD [Phycisphaerae bacterium]|jgi:flagellar hook-associated protein 2|nr:flagellar filament capping protein FliD [Phycisphaerae bacterium]
MGQSGLSGVFSGIDSDILIERSMAFNRIPLNRLNTQKRTWQAKDSALADLESRLTAFKSQVDSLRSSATLEKVKGVSVDSDILTATASTGATEGSHQVEINQLALAHRLVHNAGLAETTSAVGAGVFSYSYDSTARSISLTDETTLENLRDLINNDAQNPGVTASILEYNSAYHLVLAGKDTGTIHSIAIDDLATTIVGFDSADFVETQTAQDLQIRVDGYPAGDWITRNSNSISDVIPDVMIEARTTGSTSISITRDTTLLRSDLSNLAAVYNGLVDKISAYAGYSDTTETGGVLQGDSSINRLLDTLRSGVTSAVPGFVSGSDAFTMASEIGLEFGATDSAGLPVFEDIGKMFLNESALSSALSTDYRGVLDLIGGSGTGVSDIDDVQFTSSSDSTDGGVYNVRVDFNAAGAVTMAMIKTEGESVWRNLTISGDKLSGAVGGPEEDLNLTAVWDGSGAYTANADVRVRQGFGNVLYDRVASLLDNVTGVLTTKRQQYSSAIESVERNIEFQERLLERKETYLREKYARMETAMAKLDSQRAAFDAMFAALDNMSKNKDE